MASIQDRWNEDLGEEIYFPLCLSCAHYDNDLSCKAFPEGIPLGVFTGDFDHTKPLEGDHGIQYKQRVAKKDLLAVFKENSNHFPAGTPGGRGGQFAPKPGSKLSDGTTAADYNKGDKFTAYARTANEEKLDQREFDKMLDKKLSPADKDEFVGTKSQVQSEVDGGLETFRLNSRKSADGKRNLYTPERQRLHKRVMDRVLANISQYIPADGNPQLIILGGRGGSGKSSFDANSHKKNKMKEDNSVYERGKSHLVIDPDEIKEMIWEEENPGWKDRGLKYDPQRAALFHEESSDIADKIMKNARMAKANVVLDITMKSLKEQVIYDFAHSGYRNIEIDFIHTSRRNAAENAVSRWAGGGYGQRSRIVPSELIFNNVNNERNFDKMIKNRYVTSWSFWDGNAGYQGITKVESSPDWKPYSDRKKKD